VKNPNLEVLLGLGAGAGVGAGPVLVLRGFRSCLTSGVGPRAGALVAVGSAEEGFGEGFREEGLAGILILDLAVVRPVLDSDDAVLL
jgi:hypothetical protein